MLAFAECGNRSQAAEVGEVPRVRARAIRGFSALKVTQHLTQSGGDDQPHIFEAGDYPRRCTPYNGKPRPSWRCASIHRIITIGQI